MHSLSKAFNGMYAVDNLDLHVPEGAIYGFIGENEAADAQTFTNAWRVLEMVQGGAETCTRFVPPRKVCYSGNHKRGAGSIWPG
jgi:ABC-type uncharacterized transport system ATPase subunit